MPQELDSAPAWYWTVNSHGLECLGSRRHTLLKMSHSVSRKSRTRNFTYSKNRTGICQSRGPEFRRERNEPWDLNILVKYTFHLIPRPSSTHDANGIDQLSIPILSLVLIKAYNWPLSPSPLLVWQALEQQGHRTPGCVAEQAGTGGGQREGRAAVRC